LERVLKDLLDPQPIQVQLVLQVHLERVLKDPRDFRELRELREGLGVKDFKAPKVFRAH
jgi:hypothetical protein